MNDPRRFRLSYAHQKKWVSENVPQNQYSINNSHKLQLGGADWGLSNYCGLGKPALFLKGSLTLLMARIDSNLENSSGLAPIPPGINFTLSGN